MSGSMAPALGAGTGSGDGLDAGLPAAQLSAKPDFQSVNPATRQPIGQVFKVHTQPELDAMTTKANAAFKQFRKVDVATRVKLLRDIADALEEKRGVITMMCAEETAYKLDPRVNAEFTRMLTTIRGYAARLEAGKLLPSGTTEVNDERRLLKALPSIVSTYEPVGVVLDIESSNFPFAFGAFGTNPVSALAAGCTVIQKVCGSHANTSALIAETIQAVIAKSEGVIPADVFQLMIGTRDEIAYLAGKAEIKAVSITGSKQACDSIARTIAARPSGSIPLYAENGSVNPVVILPGAVKDEAASGALVTELSGSSQLCVGQFCTNPGMLLVVESPNADAFVDKLAANFASAPCGTMLSDKILKGYNDRIAELKADGAKVIAESTNEPNTSATQARPVLLEITLDQLRNNPSLGEEAFGPSSVVLRVNADQIAEALQILGGQLTTTIRCDPQSEREAALAIVDITKTTCGRTIINGVPTGVDVCDDIIHGGPYPASSDARYNSVGYHPSAALRFVYPVSVQGIDLLQ